MKLDMNPTQLTRSFSRFFHRFHVLIFVVFVIGGLSTATFLLSQALTAPSSADTTNTSPAGFDKTTIEKINSLRSASDQPAPLTMPAGRTNPFQ